MVWIVGWGNKFFIDLVVFSHTFLIVMFFRFFVILSIKF